MESSPPSPPELVSDPAPTKGACPASCSGQGNKNLRDETQETCVYTVGSAPGGDKIFRQVLLVQHQKLNCDLRILAPFAREENFCGFVYNQMQWVQALHSLISRFLLPAISKTIGFKLDVV